MKSRSLAALAPLVLAAFLVAGALSGEPAGVSAQGRAADATAPADALKSLQWRNIGPTAQAGRVSVFVGLPGDIDTMYVAGAVGGIFKTTNGGVTLERRSSTTSRSRRSAPSPSRPSDPNVIYVGTGEGNPRNNASIGDGVYKSIDAGEHWTNVGLPDTREDRPHRHRPAQRRRRLRLRAGPRVGPERGARPLQDDRRRQELEEGPLPERPDRLLGRRHRPDQREHRLRRDVHVPPLGLVHRVGRRRDGRLQVGRRRRHLDAAVRAGRQPRPAEGTDGPHRHRRRAQQPEHRLRDQRDEGRRRALAHRRRRRDVADGEPRPEHQLPAVLLRRHPRRSAATRTPSTRSRAASTSPRTAAAPSPGSAAATHGDHQAMWIDPTNPNRILLGDDGGFQISYDAGRTFDILNNIPFTQFYNVTYDLQTPYHLCGGLQDNGTLVRAEPDAWRAGHAEERVAEHGRRRRVLRRARPRRTRTSSTTTCRAA